MCVWIYLRHYLNLRIILSLFTEFKTVGPYELNWETQQYKCSLSFYITLALLASLQALNLFWLFFIIRIAYRFVVYQDADDDRSEAEESELEERESKPEAPPQKSVETALLQNGNGNGNTRSAMKTRSQAAASAKSKSG
jgi:very-long-chain ceramide synthase